MTRIVLFADSAEFEQRFREATGGAFLLLPPGPIPTNPEQLVRLLHGAALPDIIVIDAGSAVRGALELTERLRDKFPSIAVLLVSDAEQEIGLAALRAGVRDVLHPQADVVTIRAAIDRAAALPTNPSDIVAVPSTLVSGRVLSVVSPKGGVGKTTLATNLAVGLARAEPGSTVLVDLDVQFGDVATALNLTPDYSLLDTVRGPASRDTMALKTFLTLHPTGLYAICAPESPAAADTISGDEVSRLLEMLSSQFRYVVVDTAPGLSEHTLAAMDRTTDLILITSMDVLGVRGLRKELDILAELELQTDTRTVVINFCDPRGGLTIADVSSTIGTSVDHELPVSPIVLPSLNQGVPLLQKSGRDPMVKKLEKIVTQFTAAEVTKSSGRHAGIGRLKKVRV
ncbi:AAA family ATPase [Georgenia daeguensis]|uniref:Response regulator n=1 Tax=Georgenia daeguensis TaxID=908355 RepID=A0ABP8ERI1_9MICO